MITNEDTAEERNQVNRAIDRMMLTGKRGDVWSVRREANFFKHCLVNTKSKLGHAEQQLKKTLRKNPHVVVGEANTDSVQRAKAAMVAVYHRIGRQAPQHVLTGLENQVRQTIKDFQESGGEQSWHMALVFEFEEVGGDTEIKRWMPVLLP